MTQVPITAATYLGDNTMVVLDEVARLLGTRGIEVRVAGGERTSEAARLDAREIDLVWICGALFAHLDATGRLDHDVVAAPVFDGESAPVYRSVVVARPDGPTSTDEALDGTVAINESASWSGHRALRHHTSPRWFAHEIETGSHVASMRAVADRVADCAAIDHTIWQHELGREGPTSELRVIDRTDDWPAPPLILRRALDPDVRDQVTHVLQTARCLTGVRSFRPVDADRYEVMT